MKFGKKWLVFRDNSLDAWNPEMWAQESLMILEGNLVMANRVHRDFEPIIASYGDVVNTRQPAKFTAVRKTANDDVTIQNATATNVPVRLDQLLHVSFMIRDAQQSTSFADLVVEYLRPALLAQAEGVDFALMGRIPAYIGNVAGGLGTMSSSTAKANILAARLKMNQNKVPGGRDLFIAPNTESEILKVDNMLDASFIGDDGTALREASLGRKLAFNFFMQQSVPSTLAASSTTVAGAINNVGGYAAGVSTTTVDGFSAAIAANSMFVIAGDDIPHRVVSTVGGATPTSITFTPALKSAVANDAVVTVYTPGAVNLVAGYAAGYAGSIAVDGFSVAPQVGQFLSFGSATDYYMVTAATTTSITLDRNLDAAIANDATVNLFPAGDYNLALHRNALALVTRPLVLPRPGTGAVGSVVSYNGLSVRVVMSYDGTKQGTLVTVDMLYGTAVLDTALGCVLLG